MDDPQITDPTEPTESSFSIKSQEQPKNHLAKSKFDLKHRAKLFTQSLLAGESQTQALINAGYSKATAQTGEVAILQKLEYLKPFISILTEKGVTDEFLAEKTKTLLNAKKTLFFQKDGKVTNEREVEALETQRKTLELATKLKGHLKDRSEIDVNIGIMAMVVAAVKGENGGD
jgi:phage terminase small subunit